MSSSNKSKSQKRFEQLNQLVDVVAPKLKAPSEVAVLLVLYRHARDRGEFQVSISRIAVSARLSERQVKRIMAEFRRIGLVEQLTEHNGSIPPLCRITGKVRDGVTGDTIEPA